MGSYLRWLAEVTLVKGGKADAKRVGPSLKGLTLTLRGALKKLSQIFQ